MLKVTCQAADYVSINALEEFQGGLKTLPQKQLDKLKKSLKKHGFSFPRKCFMMEIDETYCSVILERWENFTGKKAVKEAKRG